VLLADFLPARLRAGCRRIHQFEKVEQFVICSPEGDESWQVMDEMLGNAEDFYQVRAARTSCCK
jgi:seryl-tRNA synthetase